MPYPLLDGLCTFSALFWQILDSDPLFYIVVTVEFILTKTDMAPY